MTTWYAFGVSSSKETPIVTVKDGFQITDDGIIADGNFLPGSLQKNSNIEFASTEGVYRRGYSFCVFSTFAEQRQFLSSGAMVTILDAYEHPDIDIGTVPDQQAIIVKFQYVDGDRELEAIEQLLTQLNIISAATFAEQTAAYRDRLEEEADEGFAFNTESLTVSWVHPYKLLLAITGSGVHEAWQRIEENFKEIATERLIYY